MDLRTEFCSKKTISGTDNKLDLWNSNAYSLILQSSVLDQNSNFVNVSSANVISFKQAPDWHKRQNMNFHTDAHLYTL